VIRAFVAVPLPFSLRRRLADLGVHLKKCGVAGRPTKPEAMHITLKFLGDIAEETVQAIADRLNVIGESLPPFDLKTNRIGAFPNPRRPRVVWMGFEPCRHLNALQQRLEAELETLEFQTEKRAFTPHVTLLRIKRPRNIAEILGEIGENPDPSLQESFLVDKVHLYRSLLKPSGAEYLKLATGNLTMVEGAEAG